MKDDLILFAHAAFFFSLKENFAFSLIRKGVPIVRFVIKWKPIVLGLTVGEVCNREGCKGIIEDGERSGDGCSCFINGPCSYCMQDVAFCPVCDWHAGDD